MNTHLSQLVRTFEHTVHRTPSNIAVERNPKRLVELTLQLELLKVFDPLSRCLYLWKLYEV
jgi:hypothetical protein